MVTCNMAQFCTSTELQVGLSCDKGVHTAALLAPWCCVLAWRHVLAQLEKMSVLLGLDWEVGDGSNMGAVKLGNFIPWDIDM